MPRHARTFDTAWNDFLHLAETKDSLAREHRGLRRWFLRPYVAFIVPIQDQTVIDWLTHWQQKLCPWMGYDPQPVEGLHITLHDLGRLHRKPWWLWLPRTWQHAALIQLAEQVRETVESRPPFEVQVGPLNAFPNVLFAEVQDCNECLRSLRVKLRRALPLKARVSPPRPYLPHVTLGYWGQQPAPPVIEALHAYHKIDSLPLKVTQVKLTVYTSHSGALSRDVLHAAREEVIAEFQMKG